MYAYTCVRMRAHTQSELQVFGSSVAFHQAQLDERTILHGCFDKEVCTYVQ